MLMGEVCRLIEMLVAVHLTMMQFSIVRPKSVNCLWQRGVETAGEGNEIRCGVLLEVGVGHGSVMT